MTMQDANLWLKIPPKPRYWGLHECWKPATDARGYRYCPTAVLDGGYPVYTEAKVEPERPDFTKGPQVQRWFNEKSHRGWTRPRWLKRVLRSINIVSLPQSKHRCNYFI